MEKNDSSPLPRVVNGFRLKPFLHVCPNGTFVYLWVIQPDDSPLSFYFSTLESAEEFAKNEVNSHSSRYWLLNWNFNYSPLGASRLIDKMFQS